MEMNESRTMCRFRHVSTELHKHGDEKEQIRHTDRFMQTDPNRGRRRADSSRQQRDLNRSRRRADSGIEQRDPNRGSRRTDQADIRQMQIQANKM
ncbi:hypothetical protein Tco_1129670 [Tanacetum coccineum]